MNYVSQLISMLQAAGWTQEQLAGKLGVSFATLNSWINQRSTPRAKAVASINNLYLEIVGVDEVDPNVLATAKQTATKLRINPKILAKDKSLMDKLTLYLTYHTNTIEGSTMTLADVKDVIFEHKVLKNRTAIEQIEAHNHQATLHWLVEKLAVENKNFTIDKEFILNLHLRLMNGIIADAGQFRNHSVRIMGSQVVLANWAKIPKLIDELIKELGAGKDRIAIIAETHARFEQIHPYSDGNGRVGRLIMLAQALRAGLVPPLVIKERKHAYYKYLELAQTKGDYRPLEQFIAESMQFTDKLLKNK